MVYNFVLYSHGFYLSIKSKITKIKLNIQNNMERKKNDT